MKISTLTSSIILLVSSPQLLLTQFTSLLASRALGFSPAGFRNPLHPLNLPNLSNLPSPVSPPSLVVSVPHNCVPGCTLLDLLAYNPVFSTFVAALKLSGLVTLLTEPGPFTVFAPTNAAFEGIPPIKLQAILADPTLLRATILRHLSNGRLVSGTFPAGSFPVQTGGGEEIVLTTSPAHVGHLAITSGGGAVGNVVQVDNEAANGVIHVIDLVL